MSIQLRPYRFSDKQDLVRFANNPRIAANVRDAFPSPYTAADADYWLNDCIKGEENKSQINRVIALGDQLIGGIGLIRQKDVYRFNAEIGYWLAEPYWGRGFVSEAVQQLSAKAFATMNIHRIYAGVFSYNKASMRVLEKAGFTLEAIHKQAVCKSDAYWDEYLYVKFRP
ncbi:GNAT family N-acetyltransferase [Telluribacter humicola]|uniref:GNAT family N-acetyltransferase n=1 Tax=Telluribacter humicola TaxID=1720261 RepID=UPI001A971128|nr:GNAT family N-acetyltransferase [Telluribacter humicola]